MNDEIKEILKVLEKHDILSTSQDCILKDYITNLQQENERLKQNINVYQEEIKFIRECNHRNLGERIKLQDYKSRCEKASDNLKRNYWINEHEHNDDVVNMTLNILQNGSDE